MASMTAAVHLQWCCPHRICCLHDAGWQVVGSALQISAAVTAQQSWGKLADTSLQYRDQHCDGGGVNIAPACLQVQKTCAKLEEQGFFCVRTIECLLRGYEVKQERLRTDLEPREPAPKGQGQKGQKRKRVRLESVVAAWPLHRATAVAQCCCTAGCMLLQT